MFHSLINPDTHVTARAYPAAVLPQPSQDFPANIPRRHASRVKLLSNRVRSFNAVALDMKDAIKWKNEFHEVELKVRECELNQNGIVSATDYQRYCEYGCHEFLREVVGVIADRNADVIASTETSLESFAPLRSGDRFVLKVRVYNSTAARMFFELFIFKIPNQELILEAKATLVWLNKDYRPVRIPTEVRSKLGQNVLRHDEDAK